jgi:large subunit ribosomal protein L31e
MEEMASAEENLERVYTINLGRGWLTQKYKRTDRVVNMIREFAHKHMKSNEIKLEQDLNRQIWSRGKTNPPRKVRVKMVKDEDGVVTVSLYEELPEAKADEQRQEPAATGSETTETPTVSESSKEEPKAEEKSDTANKS